MYQIGRLYCEGGTEIALHPHLTWIELTVITAGRGQAETNGERVSLQQGDIHLSFPGDLHCITSDSNAPLEYDFLSFWSKDPELLSLLEETVTLCKTKGINLFQDQRISDLVSAGIGESNTVDNWSKKLLESILEQIVYSLIRRVRNHSIPSTAISSADEMCYQMMQYMDTHVYSLKNLSQLAEAMNYNYSYLSDIFRSVTGNTLQHYLRDRKLERAQLLIREGVPLGQIAELLQYSSIYTFSRAFRDRYGIPPGQYRKGQS